MNIDRVSHRVAEVGIRRPEGPRRAFDLTVSDQGIKEGNSTVAEHTAPAITSTQEMQSVLSTEETRALHAAFFTRNEATAEQAPTAPSRMGGVYNLRGQSAPRGAYATSGSMLDITG
jgi:hypothetical protein